ncbi:hypothetical protein EVAR_67860_1 [Eumeta japonica]|uniref:DDE Tnp4 domain-containing protein n=1 Tax=Eumeta variegata TaxID=151549 RepID=A0A4C2A8X6_EUMVA|nr:hypothetical protein EVAR_67860_1 [Eumeta japonica]
MHPLYEYLRNCRQHGETLWMLGDSGYPQRNLLMTPILNALPGTKDKIYTGVVPAALAPTDGTSRAPEVFNVVSTTFRT